MGRSAKPWYREAADSWYATIGGRQRLLARGKKSKAEATRIFHQLKAKEKEEEAIRAAFPLKVLANHFLVAIERTHEEESRADYIIRVKGFVHHAGRDVPACEVKAFHLTAWLDSHRWGPSTRAKAGKIIKRMFAHGVEQGYLPVSPIAKFKTGAVPRRAMVMTNAQADAVYARVAKGKTGDNFRNLLTALRETGCRTKEVYTLTADRVDLEAGTWKVLDKIRKKTGEEFRTVYLSPRMVELSRELVNLNPEGLIFRNRSGKAWNKAAVSARFQKLQKELAYGPECIPYAYRHLYITDALERGVHPATLAELVGHTDLTMIMKIYSRLKERTEHLREAADVARSTSEAQSRPEAWGGATVASSG
jgi:integrase